MRIRGRIFRFNDNTLLLIQFMLPKVWRIRFSPWNRQGSDYSDYNRCVILPPALIGWTADFSTAELSSKIP